MWWTHFASSLLNHLLRNEEWARNRLCLFAGQSARFELGRHYARFRISPSGLLESENGLSSPAATVCLRLPDDALARILTDRTSLFPAVTISGSVELAETLGLVFRNLRWDPEDDAAAIVGDVSAHRGFQLLRQLAGWQRTAASRLLTGIAEHLGEDRLLIPGRQEILEFCEEVDHLRDECARLEKRLQFVSLR